MTLHLVLDYPTCTPFVSYMYMYMHGVYTTFYRLSRVPGLVNALEHMYMYIGTGPTGTCTVHWYTANRSGCRSISALASPGLCSGVLGELNPGLDLAEPTLGEVMGSGFSIGERYCRQ